MVTDFNNIEEKKEYMKKYSKKYREENKSYFRIKSREWRERNKLKDMKSKKEWAESNRDKVSIIAKNYYVKNKIKAYARNVAQKFPIAKECGICKLKNNLQRHHWNYKKPLLFSTLCSTCHGIQHTSKW